MTYKPWPCVAKFNHSGTFVYFNKGENGKGEPMLGVNVNGSKGFKSKITVFDNMKVDMIDNLIIAVKEVFGFDYIAYLKASGRLEQGDMYQMSEQELDMLEASQVHMEESVKRVVSTAELTDDGKSCLRCGNEPGDNWKFTLGAAICGVCGKVYRS